MGFFIWLEDTALSIWVREEPSLWGFPFILFLHTLGLALIAGLSSAVALGMLWLPQRSPLQPLLRLFPLMWIGLAINAVSGTLLLLAYPAKALTNPVFYIKLVAIAGAVGIVQWLQKSWRGGIDDIPLRGGVTEVAISVTEKRAALALIALWAIATLTGRLLAYTHSILMASLPFI